MSLYWSEFWSKNKCSFKTNKNKRAPPPSEMKKNLVIAHSSFLETY